MRTYEDIDPGMYPSDLAEAIDDLANEYEEAAGEEDCGHNPETAKACRKVANILKSAAEKLRKIKL